MAKADQIRILRYGHTGDMEVLQSSGRLHAIVNVVGNSLFVGARVGGIALGTVAGIGLVVLISVFRLPPGMPPRTVLGMILAVITAAASMQAAGGLDYRLCYRRPSAARLAGGHHCGSSGDRRLIIFRRQPAVYYPQHLRWGSATCLGSCDRLVRAFCFAGQPGRYSHHPDASRYRVRFGISCTDRAFSCSQRIFFSAYICDSIGGHFLRPAGHNSNRQVRLEPQLHASRSCGYGFVGAGCSADREAGLLRRDGLNFRMNVRGLVAKFRAAADIGKPNPHFRLRDC
jgi:Anaerobic c4-dicarboxylate membrane transporter